jgi:hypothetical protein
MHELVDGQEMPLRLTLASKPLVDVGVFCTDHRSPFQCSVSVPPLG